MFDNVTTYHSDLDLFRELGLKGFNIELHKKEYCGQVKMGGGSYVKIWVEGLPAQFWFFEVYCTENHKTYKISTGSGGLHNYWPSIKLIAEDMLVINTNRRKK